MSDDRHIYLAFDLGASSWRAALGYEDGQELHLEEIYRKNNVPIRRNSGMFWDVKSIFQDMKNVLREVVHRSIELSAIGVDSWAVDYALLDAYGSLLEEPRCYRDPRNEGMLKRLADSLDLNYLFDRTGSQAEDITTLCQLLAAKEHTPDLLERAFKLLFIPDLFRFWLCNEQATDFTLASTSQLYNISKKDWDKELLTQLQLPSHFLPRIYEGASIIGCLSENLQAETGLSDVPVVTGASHDTAAAFAAANADEDSVILSSGTWSIIGVNLKELLSGGGVDPLRFGYEGNPDGLLRLVHNVPGMYLLERCRIEWERQGIGISYERLIDDARKCAKFQSYIDPFWQGFVNIENMPNAIALYCTETGQAQPKTPAECARAIFLGLARTYAKAIEELREITRKPLKKLIVVGGGSQNLLLNELTSEAAEITVCRGCVEASIMGNIISQQQALNADINR